MLVVCSDQKADAETEAIKSQEELYCIKFVL